MASGPYMVEGVRADSTSPLRRTSRSPRPGFVPPVIDRGQAEVQDARLPRAGPEPVLGSGDRPAPAGLPRSDRAHAGRRTMRRSRASVDAGELDLAYSAQPRRSSRSRGIGTTQSSRSACLRRCERPLVRRDDEPRRSALRRRPRPPAVARAIDRAALVELLSEPPTDRSGCSRGGRDAHRRPTRSRADSSRVRSVPVRPRRGSGGDAASTYDETATDDAMRRRAGASEALVIDLGVLLEQAGRSATTWREVGIDARAPDRVCPGVLRRRDSARRTLHDPRAQIPIGDRVPVGEGLSRTATAGSLQSCSTARG